MKKKALVLSLALALALSQAALAVGAGSITVNNGVSGSGSSGGSNKSDQTSSTVTVIDSATGTTTTTGGSSSSGSSSSGSTTTDSSTTATSQDTVNGIRVSIEGGPSTGAEASAASEVTQEEAAEMTAALSSYDVSVTNTFDGYVAGGVNAINAVNANPAALATLPSTEDLTQYVMLTGFQELNITDAAGSTVSASAGQCVAISVPALMPGMQVYLLYVDPLSYMTVKVEAKGVDYENQQVLIDAAVPGAFCIVYSR